MGFDSNLTVIITLERERLYCRLFTREMYVVKDLNYPL